MKVCPNCGHNEIFAIGDYVEAKRILAWTEDGAEPLEYGESTMIYNNFPPYICPFCFSSFAEPKEK